MRKTFKKEPKSQVLVYYHRFENLAFNYAARVFSYERLGYEYEDLVQEFKIKIYTSIIAYAERWARYKLTGRYRPMPIDIYIKSALSNKVKDFIKQINLTPVKALSIEQDSFDYARHFTIESFINLEKQNCTLEINGVNLLKGLSPVEARCFMLYLNGFPIGRLQKIFKKVLPLNGEGVRSVSQIINDQKEMLMPYKEVLLQNRVENYYNFELAEN